MQKKKFITPVLFKKESFKVFGNMERSKWGMWWSDGWWRGSGVLGFGCLGVGSGVWGVGGATLGRLINWTYKHVNFVMPTIEEQENFTDL